MSRKNSFTDETHFLFLEENEWECSHCGKSHSNCGHHIFGRGTVEGCEKSPFNYAPLNNHECHLPFHGQHMTDEGKKALFQKTLQILEKHEYVLTKEDDEFLTKYGKEINKFGLTL